MTVRAMLVILLRIAAIVFLFKAVQAAPELLTLLGKDDGYEGYAAARNLGLVYFMVNLIVAFVLWIYPEKLIPKLHTDPVPDTPIAARHLKVALYSTVGIYFLFSALPDIAYFVMLQRQFTQDSMGALSAEQKAGWYASVVQAVLGLILSLYNKLPLPNAESSDV